MFNSVLFLQIKHNLTKTNFELFFKAGKTNTFPVFHVENVKFSQCYGVLCLFQCRNTCNLG